MKNLELNDLRGALIRQEETIIFSLIERAQFKRNSIIYKVNGIPIAHFNGSFLDYLLWETEKIHSKVRRYTSPDEHPFFRDLPDPILPPMNCPDTVMSQSININHKIQELYQKHIIPKICEKGDDKNYGSSATCDVICLQALSKRIHYGKFVAETKFQHDPTTFKNLIKSKARAGILECITDEDIEEKLLQRVEQKAAAYGRDIDMKGDNSSYKIAPQTIAYIYKQWILPLTKEVEVGYLLARFGD